MPPAPRKHMHPATLRLVRATRPARTLLTATSALLAGTAWLATVPAIWAPICAWPTMQTLGIWAGSSTGITVTLAAWLLPTRTPAWRTIAWAWLASVTAGALTVLATWQHMETWASWPTVTAVGAACLVTCARTHSSARTLARLARETRWMR